jgi:hypothetical protein
MSFLRPAVHAKNRRRFSSEMDCKGGFLLTMAESMDRSMTVRATGTIDAEDRLDM